MKDDRDPPVRILSLDGGGVRGLSQLIILDAIMQKINPVSSAQKAAQSLRPCEFFDLICGTSTGGLNALMLGRLGMVPCLPNL
jgi:patatin-like phospholipase/acyl hydrolase